MRAHVTETCSTFKNISGDHESHLALTLGDGMAHCNGNNHYGTFPSLVPRIIWKKKERAQHQLCKLQSCSIGPASDREDENVSFRNFWEVYEAEKKVRITFILKILAERIPAILCKCTSSAESFQLIFLPSSGIYLSTHPWSSFWLWESSYHHSVNSILLKMKSWGRNSNTITFTK